MISLAMIVKNEETGIKRALESARGSVGEIVVVDTGSMDRTKEIAGKFGATLVDRPFDGDFSAARNVAISACRGEWILFLDGDEFFPLSPKIMLEAAVDPVIAGEPNSYKGYYLLRHNYEESAMEVTYSDYVLRLFRNGPGVRYRHRVHETVEDSLDSIDGKYGKLTAMPLSHHLFERDETYAGAKRALYLEGLLKDIAENPADAGRYDFLGCEYVRLGRLKKAEEAFQKFLRLMPGDPGGLESLEMVRRLIREEGIKLT